MRTITIVGVCKSYHNDEILQNLNLTIPSGQFFALLGPSGSGKTTLLRLIAGFEEVDAGKIYIGNKDITHTPINERKVNTVFQQYALFPHLNVFDNVAYGLRIKKMDADLIEQKVHKMLKVVGLEKQMYKAINQLSGGQKQRVALARAVVNEPDVLLLDEPLAALDQNLREKMLVELIELQDTLKTTFVYITHDQAEALTVADTMAIMNRDGQIEQVGTPKEIYEFPTTSFVARFVGTTTIMTGTLKLTGQDPVLDVPYLGELNIALPKELPAWIVEGGQALLSIRPEKVRISRTPLEGYTNVLQGIVTSIIYYGRSTQYNVLLKNDTTIEVFTLNDKHITTQEVDYDDNVYIYWQKENAVLLKE